MTTVRQRSVLRAESLSNFCYFILAHLLSDTTFWVILLCTFQTYVCLLEMFLSSSSQLYLVVTDIACV